MGHAVVQVATSMVASLACDWALDDTACDRLQLIYLPMAILAGRSCFSASALVTVLR